VEQICETHYRRQGFAITVADGGTSLQVNGPSTPELVGRLRNMFDLDTDHYAIEAHLALAPAFLPGAWCPFELAVRAVLGQQISVVAARTLAGRLVTRCPITPDSLASTSLDGLSILPSRASTLRALANAAQSSSFAYGRDELLALPGIGPWTAEYIRMRACRDADAFPAGDLILRRVAVPGRMLTERDLLKYAERWRPYRAYAAIALWSQV